jgi:hypothetical protein
MKYLLLLMAVFLCGCEAKIRVVSTTNEPTERFKFVINASEDYRPFTVTYETANPSGACYIVFVSTNGNELRIDMPRTNYLWFLDNAIRWE